MSTPPGWTPGEQPPDHRPARHGRDPRVPPEEPDTPPAEPSPYAPSGPYEQRAGPSYGPPPDGPYGPPSDGGAGPYGQPGYGGSESERSPYGPPPGGPYGPPSDGGAGPYGQPVQGRSPYDRGGSAEPPYGPPGGQYGDPADTGSFPGFAGAYPAEPEPSGPARARRSRRTVWLAVGALVLVGVVVAVGVFVFLRRTDPRQTAEAFLSAMKSKDFAAAHGALCRDGKGKESPDDLKKDFQLDKNAITAYAIGSVAKSTKDSNATTVRATLSYDTGTKVDVALEVVDESGGKVCGFTLPG